MTSQKGVHVGSLGTFTFSQQKLDIGTKFIMIQRPIFLLAGKLAQSQGLKQARPLAAATHIPVVQLNFTAVSQETPFSRDTVEGCVRETLLLLVRALASEQHLFLTFPGIGVLSFKNKKRPGSSASLVSRLQRPQTAYPITLPAICSPQPDINADDKDGLCTSPAPDQKHTGEDPQQRESKSHQPLQPVKMKAVSPSEELNAKPPTEATDKFTFNISPPEVAARQQEEPQMNVSCSGHTRAGQELCYLCMQRAQKNIPIYLREERLAEEQAQEKLLLIKEQQRDKLYMEQQQAKMKEQREHAKQVAEFNLEISGMLRKEKAYCPLYPTSFIFPDRPLTPARRIKQHHYMNELQTQVESKRQHEARDQHNRLLMEHLDRVQLAQEINLQKAQQFQQKQERTKTYKRALDTQVEDRKGTGLPEGQPDNSGFVRCETAVTDIENRERAQKVFHENFSAATQRKKDKLHNHQAQVEEEREMLEHNRRELILDRMNRFEKKWDIRKSLEDDWSRTAKLKHQREEEDRHFLRSAGQLLIDKFAQYRSCYQCKRRPSNCGESNIWRDSHYISGSHFMI
ncbi:hypothetical protein LDENG_00064850 [Lucifuga dentata]|nr:hypothetical protein LDENG_00064850 [Lucifuga dentata]